ncbi:mitogen-activated protein kinase 15 isoform X3 [Ailuropoda melanoleuca]|uniref:mitogen-activated protein kinase 15 isoform X3 n=1 Tax=Ailuropoda melanoleuca TaxID=9646 RepID=UPI001494C085|nr:mitogen-activated protein kinase 15 isoform X3 [Ailuropoda melanoleuca]
MCAAEVDHHVAQRYLLKRRLGKGAYGIVWKAVDRRTGEVVAIKKIFDAFRDKTDAQELGDHPNIIRLLDVIRAENDRDIYLVFESMDTDLNAVICKGKLLRDVHKRYIIYQLLRATKFIHSGRVIHRDQKPSNILLDSSCLVKLCDFGLARSLSGLPEGPEGQALTDYVATRWYRAPEVLLSSSWYTPGVDMWSLGCILGEMLRGRPLFPGTSTLHQLELILETIPPPSKEDLLALGSSYSASILPCLGSRGQNAGARRPRQTLDTLLPSDTPPEALDLLRRLLVFAPDKRLSAAQALQHPYVQRFHCPAREWTLDSAVRLPVLEGVQLSAPEYRSRVYQVLRPRPPPPSTHAHPRRLPLPQRPPRTLCTRTPLSAPLFPQMVLERRGNSCVPRDKGLGSTAPGAQPSAPWSQAPLLKSRVIPQPAPGSPPQNSGRRPPSSPGHQRAHDMACGAKNLPRQSSAPLLQPPPPGGLGRGERPPGATAEAPSAPSWVKPSGKGAAPSLASQAAAQVAIQALIRSDWNPGRGVRATGARRVSSPGSPALGSLAVLPAPSAAGFSRGRAPTRAAPYAAPRPTVCRSLAGFPRMSGPRPGPAGGCSAPRPRRGPRAPQGLLSGATLKPTGPSATRRWAACPCSRGPERKPPYPPSTQLFCSALAQSLTPLPAPDLPPSPPCSSPPFYLLPLLPGHILEILGACPGLSGGVTEVPTHPQSLPLIKSCPSPAYLPIFYSQ